MRQIKLCLVIGIFVALTQATDPVEDPFSDEFIEMINKMNTTWKAGGNFHGKDREIVRGLFGSLPNMNKFNSLPILKHPAVNDRIPETFDSRTQWPDCPTVSEIRDQGACGSCWVFGAVEAISDRICIHSDAKIRVRISSEDLLTCCHECGSCDGGDPFSAWLYWVESGIVTGGNYGSNEGCQPYAFEPCEHSVNGSRPDCSEVTKETPACKKKCLKSYDKTYQEDLYFGKSVYRLESDVRQIQTEIMTNGPVEATFQVYEDILTYKTGVYKHVAGDRICSHAVRLLGWGTENGTDYWLLANSLNIDWADYGGYFKFVRGIDNCGIESMIVAGLPRF